MLFDQCIADYCCKTQEEMDGGGGQHLRGSRIDHAVVEKSNTVVDMVYGHRVLNEVDTDEMEVERWMEVKGSVMEENQYDVVVGEPFASLGILIHNEGVGQKWHYEAEPGTGPVDEPKDVGEDVEAELEEQRSNSQSMISVKSPRTGMEKLDQKKMKYGADVGSAGQ